MSFSTLGIASRPPGESRPLTPAGSRPPQPETAAPAADDGPPAAPAILSAAEFRVEAAAIDAAAGPLTYGSNGRPAAGPPAVRGQFVDLRG